MTRGERVRANAPEAPDRVVGGRETETTTKTAQKYLEQLVEDSDLRRVYCGGQTLYCVDQLMATYREVATLQREHDPEELAGTLESMQARVAEWEAEYDVESPGELLASISDVDDPDEVEAHRKIAGE